MPAKAEKKFKLFGIAYHHKSLLLALEEEVVIRSNWSTNHKLYGQRHYNWRTCLLFWKQNKSCLELNHDFIDTCLRWLGAILKNRKRLTFWDSHSGSLDSRIVRVCEGLRWVWEATGTTQKDTRPEESFID